MARRAPGNRIYGVGEVPPMTAAKAGVAALFAALIAVLNVVVDFANANPNYQTWGSIALAILGAIAVYAVPNKIKPVEPEVL